LGYSAKSSGYLKASDKGSRRECQIGLAGWKILVYFTRNIPKKIFDRVSIATIGFAVTWRASMPNQLADLEAQLTDLSKERTELDMAIEEMMADMADLPPERRSASDWASNGALTKQFLDLTNRQAGLEAEIVAVSWAITATKKPVLPH
jgi:hypothetical protein